MIMMNIVRPTVTHTTFVCSNSRTMINHASGVALGSDTTSMIRLSIIYHRCFISNLQFVLIVAFVLELLPTLYGKQSILHSEKFTKDLQ